MLPAAPRLPLPRVNSPCGPVTGHVVHADRGCGAWRRRRPGFACLEDRIGPQPRVTSGYMQLGTPRQNNCGIGMAWQDAPSPSAKNHLHPMASPRRDGDSHRQCQLDRSMSVIRHRHPSVVASFGGPCTAAPAPNTNGVQLQPCSAGAAALPACLVQRRHTQQPPSAIRRRHRAVPWSARPHAAAPGTWSPPRMDEIPPNEPLLSDKNLDSWSRRSSVKHNNLTAYC